MEKLPRPATITPSFGKAQRRHAWDGQFGPPLSPAEGRQSENEKKKFGRLGIGFTAAVIGLASPSGVALTRIYLLHAYVLVF